MVVLILARELLVTSFRGLSEGSGQSFGAAFSGKFKMVAQSVTILAILIYVNYLDVLIDHGYELYARYFRDFCIWTTLLITVFSGLAGGSAGDCDVSQGSAGFVNVRRRGMIHKRPL